MLKPSLKMTFVLLVLSFVLIAQAQDNPPITQPTVDAAVSTLLAQTQQAGGLSATGTVQAALQTAIAGTAHPQVAATPPATVAAPTINAAAVTVGAQTDLPIHAGTGGRGAYIAPDGQHIANIDGKTLCIYLLTVQQSCIDLSTLTLVDPESIHWSSDSRYLVLTENFFLTFNDSDIWVIDADNGTLKDVTDDGQVRVRPSDDSWSDVDVAPVWLPDDHILFLRYNRVQGAILPPDIYTIAADGSDLQKIGTLNAPDPFAVYTLDAQDDHLIYGYGATNDVANNGLWISDLDGSNARQILHQKRDHLPSMVDLSPDGRYVLVGAPSGSMTFQPEQSLAYVVSVEDGTELLIDPDHYIMSAGWLPVGSALIYATHDPVSDSSGVYLTAAPGSAGRLLLSGDYYGTTPTLRQPLFWAENNKLLLTRQSDSVVVLLHLSAG